MSTLPLSRDPRAVSVTVDDSMLHFILADGREIAAPLVWFPRLRDASPEERSDWRLIGKGIGVHWPQVDEDIAVETLMRTR